MHFVHWGEQSVLFHEPSGRTHLLNAAMVELLTRVLREPRTVEEAFRELVGNDPPEPDEEIESQYRVRDALLWLEELGLIEGC
jgi:PqqD family protein of HPr-rel-A system